MVAGLGLLAYILSFPDINGIKIKQKHLATASKVVPSLLLRAVVPGEVVVHVRKIFVVGIDEIIPLLVGHLDRLALELRKKKRGEKQHVANRTAVCIVRRLLAIVTPRKQDRALATAGYNPRLQTSLLKVVASNVSIRLRTTRLGQSVTTGDLPSNVRQST